MANALGFQESNAVLGPPKGMTVEQVKPLAVFKDAVRGEFISCWQLTPEELVEVNKNGGIIWLSVMSAAHPPVYVTSEYPFVVTPIEPEAPPAGAFSLPDGTA